MEPRAKLLAAVAALALVGYGLDRVALTPWMEAVAKAKADLAALRPKLEAAKSSLKDEARVAADWKRMGGRLESRRPEEAANQFNTMLGGLADSLKLEKANLKPDPAPRALASTGSRQHAVDLQFRCAWEALVKLLLELNNTDEFVRVESLSVGAQAKDGLLDVSLRLSTLAWAGPGAR